MICMTFNANTAGSLGSDIEPGLLRKPIDDPLITNATITKPSKMNMDTKPISTNADNCTRG